MPFDGEIALGGASALPSVVFFALGPASCFNGAGGQATHKPQTHEQRSQSHGRGIGRLLGNGTGLVTNGIGPVTNGSPAAAVAFCARFRIASAARWNASMCSSVLGRWIFVDIPAAGRSVTLGTVGGDRRPPSIGCGGSGATK